MGAIVGSPFFLVKIRMQSQSSVFKIGTQYNYPNTFSAFASIFKNEGGFRGIMKGVDAAAIRVASGSSVQLPTYDFSKRTIKRLGIIKEEGVALHFASSLASGVALVAVMNPFDVVSTRLYNEQNTEGKGSTYKGPFDCFFKTIKTEGVLGLYKGAIAHYLRVGPHTILTFVFFEQMKKLLNFNK